MFTISGLVTYINWENQHTCMTKLITFTYHIDLSHLLITFEGLIVALYLFHIVGNNILEN